MGIGGEDQTIKTVDTKIDIIDTNVDSILADALDKTATQVITGTSPGTGNTNTRIELDSNASSTDGAYDPAEIIIYSGTGAGQGRTIYEYDGTNKFAYVNRDWKTIPDNTSKYIIKYSCNGGMHVNEGLATGGGASTITLNSLASNQNSVYLGQMVFIVAGTGQDQARMCIGYNGTTKVMTVDSPWIVQPDNTSIYIVMPFPGFIHGRPDQNSTANTLLRDGIGNKTDYITVPYSVGVNSILAHLNTSYYHVHGTSFSYPDNANGVTLTAGTGAWNLTGTKTEVIPANALNVSAFDLHWINISNISANGTLQVDIFSGGIGAEVRIGSARATRNAVQSQEGSRRIQIPQQLVNTRISCRAADSTAGALTCVVSFSGHYYAG